MSNRQLTANKANAMKSTGPRTNKGKAVANKNATRHGLLSARLFLPGEDPDEFAALALDLQATLQPIGSLELNLIEKVAINMWRQRRLVQAETAALNLEHSDAEIASAVSGQLNLGYGNEINVDDLAPFDNTHARWCRKIITEAENLNEIDLESLPSKAPLIHAQLKQDAEADEESIEEQIKPFEHGLTGYVHDLLSWCRKELRKADKRPEILKTADLLRTKKTILPRRELELLARYQTTLDNQLFKALRALRDAQEWRMKTLEVAADAANDAKNITA